ncbi:MAG: hypothetical protein V4819_08315 [Verrucomicrobiota bacterium]
MHDSLAPTFRTAHPDEIARAAALCPPAPALPGEGPVRCFVAVDGQPERLVGAVFWREIPAEGDTPVGATFEWAMIPELADSPVETDFLIALVTEIQLAVPVARWLSPSTDLPEGHPLAERLLQAAFQQETTWTHHSAAVPDIASWLESRPAAPSPLPATAPHPSHFDPLHEVLCGNDRPLSKSQLAHGFQTAGSGEPSLFDSRCSVLLLDGDEIVAACLANVSDGHLNLTALHVPAAPVQLLPDVLRQVITRCNMFAPPLTLGFTLHPQDPPAGLPALLEIPVFQRVGTTRSFRRELHFPG